MAPSGPMAVWGRSPFAPSRAQWGYLSITSMRRRSPLNGSATADYTGDRGRRDANGYLWFEGRDDDVITSSAYRIGPFEVESALIEHPAVVEAAVVGRPDPQRTEIVCAFVIVAPGFRGTLGLVEELQTHVRDRKSTRLNSSH